MSANLHCTRPFGQKPLYYFKSNSEFIISSEISPIHALTDSATLDDHSVRHYLCSSGLTLPSKPFIVTFVFSRQGTFWATRLNSWIKTIFSCHRLLPSGVSSYQSFSSDESLINWYSSRTVCCSSYGFWCTGWYPSQWSLIISLFYYVISIILIYHLFKIFLTLKLYLWP